MPNGYYKEFYPNNTLKILGFYKDGIQDSIGIKYSAEGKLELKNYRTSGQLYGPQYAFNNGTLRSVIFYKNDTTAWFGIHYNPNRTVESVEGHPIRLITQPGFQSLNTGQMLILINEVPIVENVKTILNVKLQRNNQILFDTLISDFKSIDNSNIYPFKKELSLPGSYNYLAFVRLLDSVNGDLIRQDSIHLSIQAR